jgi:hypothetical protein
MRAREQVEQRASDVGARANSTADDLRVVAEHLRAEGKDGPAHLAEAAAEHVARAGEYLQGTDGERLIRDLEELGRRRPWAAVIGGAAVGLAASRMLKASSTDRYRSGVAPRRERITTGQGAGSAATSVPTLSGIGGAP